MLFTNYSHKGSDRPYSQRNFVQISNFTKIPSIAIFYRLLILFSLSNDLFRSEKFIVYCFQIHLPKANGKKSYLIFCRMVCCSKSVGRKTAQISSTLSPRFIYNLSKNREISSLEVQIHTNSFIRTSAFSDL